MKSKIVLFSVLAVLALFAVSAVPSASANGLDNEVYFVPEDSNGLYCENISVLILVDAVDLTTGAGMDIYFDPDCVNITNVDFTGTPYSASTGWRHWGNYVRIGVMGPMDPIQPGTYLIANLTLHCEKEAECTSNLAFTETELLDYDGDPLSNVIWHDGTFSCGVPCIPSIEVNKTVWDKESQAWVEVIAANLSDTVQFRCEMYNKGTCPLTNLVVTDTLPDSLEYTDNATVNGEPEEPEMLGPNEFRWEFPSLVLVPGQTLTIEFDAHVIDYGYDCNVQNATAMCEEIEVSDEDIACVDVSNGEDNEVYFVPEDSNGLYCENISVLILVDAVDLTTGAGMDIYFDPDCVNITNVDFTGTPYSASTGWTHWGNYVRIGVMGPMTPIQPGTHLIANLTLHCEKETECTSNLAFAETELLDYDGDPLPNVIWHDGTFTCGVPCIPSIEVNKTVWDKESQAWVDEITANLGDIVRFQCEIHNNGTCCPLTNFVVTDILSDSLEYADDATVNGEPDEPEMLGPNEFRWEFPDLVLEYCETITIEFDAHVIDYGYDCNVQNATAMCDEIEVSDEDTACVDVPELPDLTVTEITVNYDAPKLGGIAIGPEPGPGVHTECNNLSAVIEEENGVDVGSPFNVSFTVDGATLCTVRVPGLTGGANKTVYCDCSWYPYAGNAFAINVTVDSNHEISETNETNNTKWNNGTAVSNGFKGDGWQGPYKNLENVQCHDQDTNNLIYSVGDSYYAGGTWGETTNYVANWTTSDLPVPKDADILKAWLYVYYTWDKNEIMPGGVSLTFNGPGVAFARHYSDRKGFGTWNSPYGMLVYDVTTAFIATGNTAVLTKASPDTYIPIRGMLLMVVYNHPDEPERIICIDEGYDLINARASYAVTPEEATTYAPFECCEPIPLSEIGKATLVAVAPGADMGDDKNRLSFNDGLWKGAWSGFAGATELGIAEKDVRPYLKEEDNVANFQDRGDWMEASNAFLILEKEAPCPAEYAVYQANVRNPEGRLNELRALRDQKLEDVYVTRYYEHSPALTLVLSRADSDLVTDGAQLLSRYAIPVGKHVRGMDVDERITEQDVEEALSFTERLKTEVMKNRDAIGVKSTEATIDFIDEFEGQVKASEGKTFSEALKSSIYYEGGQLRVDREIVDK